MNIFKSNKDQSYTIIIGCGKLGANLAQSLSDENKNVTIIDTKKESFNKLSPNFGGLSVLANGTDIDVLKDVNIDKASSVIVVTNNDNTNIMIALLAREMFKVKHVLARLYDPEREVVYKNFGIETICPSTLSVIEIKKFLNNTKKDQVYKKSGDLSYEKA